MSGGQGQHDDPLDRLAAEEDWSRRAKAVENQVARERRMPSLRPARTPRPRRDREPRGGISLIFVALVVVMLVSAVAAWTGVGHPSLVVFFFVLSGWLVTLCLHEFSHALTAHRGGDHTVAEKGYLRLDPRKYGHPVLTLLLPMLWLLIGGLPLPGGAVMIESHRLRNRFRDALVSAAGPAVNVAASIVLLAAVALGGPAFLNWDAPHLTFWAGLTFLAYLQVATAILNLLPVPGLDGYGMIEPYLSPGVRHAGNKIKPFGILIVFALLYLPLARGLFGDATVFFLDVSGVPRELAAYGNYLFQFWKSW
ncbi:site-2 protease family protein [Catellatospora citrea]|uniref:Site-2 protease family protein n=1 Tax=Catellatospora citrea TaxID=53366 RepID=A0A8J3KGQ1_9ACTN|nr:site-2 protease family protein [Catellatospora citrea]RKE07398.1 Zn-dependent protease [Catellatospora citrea]GIF95554.1 site-2 protease family protein [Catellatospora citrea]